jgi:hypothetical protein
MKPIQVGHERTAWLLLVLASSVLVFVGASKYGLGLSPDSLAYLAGAEALEQGRGFVDRHGNPIGLWPPLFPATLALIGLVPMAAFWPQALLQSLLLGTTAWFVWSTCRRIDPWMAVLAAVVTLCSFPLLKVGVMLWSELLFTVLSLVAVTAAARCCDESASPGPFWVAMVAAALAALTRYPGVATIAACALLLLRHRGLKVAALFGLAAAAPLALWLTRNVLVSGSAAGARVGSSTSLGEILAQLPSALSLAFLPAASPLWVVGLCGAAALVALLTLRAEHSWQPASRLLLEASLAYIGCYLAVMIAGSTRTDLEVISLRYLAPIVPFAVIAVGILLGSAQGGPTTRAARSLFFAVWACFNLATALELERIWMAEGAGDFSSDTWQLSPTLRAARDFEPSQRLFSNLPDFLGYELGRIVEAMPLRDAPTEDLRRRFAPGDAIVWFQNGFRSYQIDPENLGRSLPLEVRSQLPDGLILGVAAANAD